MTRLPMATTFCSAEVDIGGGRTLFLDGNSKITAGNGTFAAPVPNALSLPAASATPGAGHCPGSTPVCRASCYVRGLAQHAPDLYSKYAENAATVVDILDAGGPVATRAACALADWINAHAAHGFRWHVSGDVMHGRHARWIVEVCTFAPAVPMWIYTRTLDAVDTLRRAPNLAVNVSADRDNYAEALECAEDTGARLCYLVSADDVKPITGARWPCRAVRCGCPACTGVPHDIPEGSVIFPDYALRGRDLDTPTDAPWWQSLTHEQRAATCPTDFFGQSEAHRCGPCRKCLDP